MSKEQRVNPLANGKKQKVVVHPCVRLLLLLSILVLSTSSFAQRDRLISLTFEDADIRTVLRTFARLGDVNIVASEDVKGKVTLDLRAVPWEQAFQTLLRVHGLTAVEERGIIGVMTMKESEEQKRVIPIKTQIFRVKYAKAKSIQPTLRSMLTERGKIEVDERTSSLIVTDIPDVLNKIGALIDSIDTATPQVMIEAKIVEVDYKAARDLGIKWTSQYTDPTSETYTGGGVDAGVAEKGWFVFGTVLSSTELFARISMLESQDKARILSQPKVAVVDNEEAHIFSGKRVPVITLDEAGNQYVRMYDAMLKLTVKPHINPKNQVLLDLRPEVSDLSSEATVQGGIILLTNEVQTTLLVEDGQTAVIGGVLKEKESKVERGVPYLCRIPLLGRLFKSVSTSKDKSEIMVFVTPHIIPIRK